MMRHVEDGGHGTVGPLASQRPGNLPMLDIMQGRPLDTAQSCFYQSLDLTLAGMELVTVKETKNIVHHHLKF